MEILVNILESIMSLLGTLRTWWVFLAGIGVGILISWPFKRISWPFKRKRDKELSELVSYIQTKVRDIDSEVDKLRTKTPPSSHRPIRAQIHNDQSTDKNSSIRGLEDAAMQLTNLEENLTSIVRDLQAQLSKRTTESPRYVSDDPVTPPIIVRRSSMNQTARSPASQSPEPDLDIETSFPVSQNTPDAMVEFYNRAVNDPVTGERFREEYSPIRIGTVNAVERRQNPTIKAEIRETSDGDFFALRIEGNVFAVFPRLGLTIEAVSYTAGAMGEVFEKTRNHDPKLFYSRYRVKDPALFRFEGGRWQLCEPGELDLGIGE